MDWTILEGAIISFTLFFVLQMIVFRMLHQEAVLTAIMVIFGATSLLHLAGFSTALSVMPDFADAGLAQKALIVGLSYFIFGLAAFVYILCVFGPSETSIRIRVVRELMEAEGHGLNRGELLNRYNAKMVLERRLDRLTRSGEIVLKDGKYVLIKKANFFFLIDSVANALHGLIKGK